MALLSSPLCNFGEKINHFNLKNVDGKMIGNKQIKGLNGTLVMFICNHCPYVKAIIEKTVSTADKLKSSGINSVAIMPNDTKNYPEDNFENMKKFYRLYGFNFPYLVDEDQKVAKKFGAVCTPDFFGYNSNDELQYRGRIAEMKDLKFQNEKNDLLDAMILISKTGKGPLNQFASSGCSIKWK